MKKGIMTFLALVAVLLLGVISGIYFFQERVIFFPEKLPKDYRFSFSTDFEELFIPVEEEVRLNALHFNAVNSTKVILYLHGNAGALHTWGEVASVYTRLGYHVFMIDYRGYGKSDGVISSEQQLFEDAQKAYDWLKAKYGEENIIVLGYSIGTGIASYLASTNNPQKLVLLAPYYNLAELARQHYPIIPAWLLKYKFQTNQFIRETNSPVLVFHGTEDSIISVGHSKKLYDENKKRVELVLLKGQEHNGINGNPEFQKEIAKRLSGSPRLP